MILLQMLLVNLVKINLLHMVKNTIRNLLYSVQYIRKDIQYQVFLSGEKPNGIANFNGSIYNKGVVK
jgi:hypothetical protein